MGLSGKHKKLRNQLRNLRDRQSNTSDRAMIDWVLDVLEGRASLSNTGDITIDKAPRAILRWRTRYAEIRITDLLLTLDAIHNTCGCCCPGTCVLSDDWVPDTVRRAKVNA